MSQKEYTKRLLVVDDDSIVADGFRLSMEPNGIEVVGANDGLSAIAMVEANPNHYPVVIVDYHLPDLLGDEIVRRIREKQPRTIAFIYTGDSSEEVIKESLKSGAEDHFKKSVDPVQTTTKILEAFKLQEENSAHVFFTGNSDNFEKIISSEGLIGRSKELAEAVEYVQETASTVFPMLILGETGTGKELIAKAVSKRREGPFVAINCATLQENTVESELFGHERGAFTGADKQKRGLFESANLGTLFLDEIHCLSPKMQAKLLRVLQESEVRRLGGNVDINIDVKVIAASKPELADMTREGSFLLDLYARLDVFSVKLPPLRERPEDIEPLFNSFLNKYCDEIGFQKTVSALAVREMEQHSWPGNIRDLENLALRALARNKGPIIDAEFIKKELSGKKNQLKVVETYEELQEKFLKDRYILAFKVLEKNGNNQSKAAKEIGVAKSTFSEWLKQGPPKKMRRRARNVAL